MQAIETDPARDLRDLARMVNLSSSRLSHLFKATTGVTLQRFLSLRRLEAAAELLQSTEMPIKEVSYSVGYRHAPVAALSNVQANLYSDILLHHMGRASQTT